MRYTGIICDIRRLSEGYFFLDPEEGIRKLLPPRKDLFCHLGDLVLPKEMTADDILLEFEGRVVFALDTSLDGQLKACPWTIPEFAGLLDTVLEEIQRREK